MSPRPSAASLRAEHRLEAAWQAKLAHHGEEVRRREQARFARERERFTRQRERFTRNLALHEEAVRRIERERFGRNALALLQSYPPRRSSDFEGCVE